LYLFLRSSASQFNINTFVAIRITGRAVVHGGANTNNEAVVTGLGSRERSLKSMRGSMAWVSGHERRVF
jgi:hypothetical protein